MNGFTAQAIFPERICSFTGIPPITETEEEKNKVVDPFNTP